MDVLGMKTHLIWLQELQIYQSFNIFITMHAFIMTNKHVLMQHTIIMLRYYNIFTILDTLGTNKYVLMLQEWQICKFFNGPTIMDVLGINGPLFMPLKEDLCIIINTIYRIMITLGTTLALFQQMLEVLILIF